MTIKKEDEGKEVYCKTYGFGIIQFIDESKHIMIINFNNTIKQYLLYDSDILLTSSLNELI